MQKKLLFFLTVSSVVLNASQAVLKKIDDDTVNLSVTTQEEDISVSEDTSLASIPKKKCAEVFKLLMVQCLLAENYEGVTNVMESTALHPGDKFTQLLERGMILPYHHVKKISNGRVYLLFEAASRAKHKRLIRLLADEKCLAQANQYALLYEDFDISKEIAAHSNFAEQQDRYCAIGRIYDSRELKSGVDLATILYKKLELLDEYYQQD